MTGGEAAPFRRLAVVGAGLIGGSVALAARSVGSVTVTDRDPAVRSLAAAHGFGTVTDTLSEAVADADLVVVAVPVDAVAETVLDAARHAPPGVVITDVGSTKARIQREVTAGWAGAAPPGTTFVGGHPMAGSEREGPRAADGALFAGSTWLLTPGATGSDDALRRLTAFVRTLQARVLVVDPDTHDRLVGAVSHLPQVLASALMAYAGEASADEPAVLTAAGGGFTDMTRIAASNPELWVAILAENRDAVVVALRDIIGRLDAVAAALEGGDREAVRSVLAAARDARARIPGKDVAGPLIDLVVPVADRPGALAEVATVLGAAGVNIEDVSMRHAEGVGALVVVIAGEQLAQRAVSALHQRGVAAHLEHH